MGLVPRLLESMFQDVYNNFDYSIYFTIYASYIQIYLESISDLLNPAKTKLKIYQDPNKGLWVTDATKVPVKNKDEVFKLMEMGTRYRVTAETKSNATSSRSHALLILTVQKHFRDQGNFLASQVYLVDLCGSERVSKTGAQSQRLVEAQNINQSLL